MLTAQQSGRVILHLERGSLNYLSGYSSTELIKCCVVPNLKVLLCAAVERYHYGPNEITLFCVSLGYLIPLLFSAKGVYYKDGLVFSYRYYSHLLEWGLAVGYTPRLTVEGEGPRKQVYVELCTMSSVSQYRHELSRVATRNLAEDIIRHKERFQYGYEGFKIFLKVQLQNIDNTVPTTDGESPLANHPSLDTANSSSALERLLGTSNLLFTRSYSNVARYFHQLDLPSLQVGFWHFANMARDQNWQIHFTYSNIQEVLQ